MHHLAPGPDTVHWGYFDAALKPLVTVDSGDTVTISTVSGTFGHLPKPETGLTVLPELAAIHQKVQPKLGGNPFDGLRGEMAKMLLNRVQKHQRRASLVRVVRDELLHPGFEFGWNNESHRSHSPITKSSEPKTATTSLIM